MSVKLKPSDSYNGPSRVTLNEKYYFEVVGLNTKFILYILYIILCSVQGARLPYHLHVKKFSSMDHSFESPVESYLYNQVKGPLNKLLEGKTYYSTRVFTQPGYTIDVEICLDEDGFVLPLSQWDHTHRRLEPLELC